MNKVTSRTNWRKNLLCAAVSSALLLTGCSGDDGEAGAQGAQGIQGEAGAAGANGTPGKDASTDSSRISTSGFAFPSDAIMVAPDAVDGDDITNDILLALLELPDNATVVLPKGNFVVTTTIIVPNTKDVTFMGYGISATKLDFASATGDDAIRFESAQGISIRDFSVYEAPKNGIKVINSNGVYLGYTGTIWEGELEANNGAYGLYPLQSQNVIMEHNYAYGSADAGIYVGQSNNIVVRNNVAKYNVAGIEIENSTMADVYDNLAIDNTGGILSFDLPGLVQAYGGNVRIFNNEVVSNNAENVGGGTVGAVPPGTGVLILATSDVEIYNNNFVNNETSSILVTSYLLLDPDVASYGTKYGSTIADGWSPLVKNIYMHDNTISRSGGNPRGNADLTPLIQGFVGFTGAMPAIMYDGVGQELANANALLGFNGLVSESAAADGVNYNPYEAGDEMCAENNLDANSAASAAEFPLVNIGIAFDNGNMDFSAPSFAIDNVHGNSTLMACQQTRLKAAKVNFRGTIYGCEGDDAAALACAL